MSDDNEEWEDEDMEETEEQMELTIIEQPSLRANMADPIYIGLQMLTNIVCGIGGALQMAANLAGMHANQKRRDIEERLIARHFDEDLAQILQEAPREH